MTCQYNLEAPPRLRIEKAKAICLLYLDYKTTRRVGDLFFYKGSLEPGVIAHEVTHAVCSLLNDLGFDFKKLGRYGKKFASSDEERFCRCVEQIVKTIWQELKALYLV